MRIAIEPIPLGLLKACAAEALGPKAPSESELHAWRGAEHARKYSPDQARDDAGRFADGGGSGGANAGHVQGTSAQYARASDLATAQGGEGHAGDAHRDAQNYARDLAASMDEDTDAEAQVYHLDSQLAHPTPSTDQWKGIIAAAQRPKPAATPAPHPQEAEHRAAAPPTDVPRR